MDVGASLIRLSDLVELARDHIEKPTSNTPLHVRIHQQPLRNANINPSGLKLYEQDSSKHLRNPKNLLRQVVCDLQQIYRLPRAKSAVDSISSRIQRV